MPIARPDSGQLFNNLLRQSTTEQFRLPGSSLDDPLVLVNFHVRLPGPNGSLELDFSYQTQSVESQNLRAKLRESDQKLFQVDLCVGSCRRFQAIRGTAPKLPRQDADSVIQSLYYRPFGTENELCLRFGNTVLPHYFEPFFLLHFLVALKKLFSAWTYREQLFVNTQSDDEIQHGNCELKRANNNWILNSNLELLKFDFSLFLKEKSSFKELL